MELSDFETYETLQIASLSHGISVTISRPEKRNSITGQFLEEFHNLLDIVERNEQIKVVIIQGSDGYFCTGMDFEEVTKAEQSKDLSTVSRSQRQFMHLLSRINQMHKVFVAKVDGVVMAGGVGIVASCDVVVATPRSQFTLSETLWGLLPSMVLPFLIRKIGYQKAYFMTLTSLPLDAQKASDYHLVDEISENLNDSIRKLSIRFGRLNNSTVKSLKTYIQQLVPIPDSVKDAAISETTRLVLDPQVLRNISNYVKLGVFPWEDSAVTNGGKIG